MPKRGRLPQEMWQAYRAMSTDVGKIPAMGFLARTSCMNTEERRVIGMLEFAKDVIQDEGFIAFVDGFGIPFFEKQGRAKWERDIVTDLGLALSKRASSRRSLKKLGKFKPKK